MRESPLAENRVLERGLASPELAEISGIGRRQAGFKVFHHLPVIRLSARNKASAHFSLSLSLSLDIYSGSAQHSFAYPFDLPLLVR
jgi:hypothetical protein